MPQTISKHGYQSDTSTLAFTYLQATIHVVIKNTGNHAEFFKISQLYSGDGTVNPNINWSVLSTDPTAIKMVNVLNPGGRFRMGSGFWSNKSSNIYIGCRKELRL